jgi:hypothetical protein
MLYILAQVQNIWGVYDRCGILFYARSQSYDFELQRQNSKNLQRNLKHSAFLELKLFFSDVKTLLPTKSLL